MRRFLTAISLFTVSSFAFAQPKKDAKPPAAPVAVEPTLTTPVTLGLTRGTKADLSLTGTNLKDVTHVVVIGCTQPITTKIINQEATKLTVSFDVPKDAPIGLYQLRVAGPNGISVYRPIVVDSVPTIADNGTNNRPADAQTVTWPCVITGTVTNETADYYRVTIKAGQTITFDSFAKRLGSPLDPVIILGDAKTGRERPALYSDDTPGLQTDARFVYTFPADGEYLVTVRDTTYKGGDNFHYRLRITEGPAALVAVPAIVERGKPTSFAFVSQSAKPIASVTATVTEDGWLAVPGDAWPVPVWTVDGPTAIETAPNDTRETALPMPVGGVTGRFEKKSDLDFYSVSVKKGEKWEAIARTAEIGSPCEVLLKIQDQAGKTLAESDPMKTTARAEFTAPADGTYFVSAEHLNYLFGPGEVYHLTMTPMKPKLTVSAAVDRVVIPRGAPGLIPLPGIEKQNGDEKTPRVDVVSPVLRGSMSIADGWTKENPGHLPVWLTEKPTGFMTFTVTNTNAVETCRAGLNGLPHLPPGWANRFVAFDVPAAPLSLAINGPLTVKAGQPLKVTVTAKRTGFDGDIPITLLGLPALVTVKPATIAKGATSATIELTVDAKAKGGAFALFARGTAEGRFTHSAEPVLLTVTADAAAEVKPDPKAAPKKK